MLEIFTSPATAPWWHSYTLERCHEDLDWPDDHQFAIELDGEMIGIVQYSEEDEPDYRHASMDIALHTDVIGRGLGTDALRTMARHLVDDRGHHRITIDPAVDNTTAIASYSKIGFKPVGIERQAERTADGTWRDALLMDLLAAELT
jgi:aminoglycoside 6'-N-acetyltransferase